MSKTTLKMSWRWGKKGGFGESRHKKDAFPEKNTQKE